MDKNPTPVQETQVQSLIQKDSTCSGITKPVCHNHWAQELQQLKPVDLEPVLRNKRSSHTTMKRDPHSPQLEKACTQQWRPNTTKKINKFKTKTNTSQSLESQSTSYQLAVWPRTDGSTSLNLHIYEAVVKYSWLFYPFSWGSNSTKSTNHRLKIFKKKLQKVPKSNVIYIVFTIGASLVAQMVKRLPAMQETRVRFLGWEDPLEKEMAIPSSTLAWKIPWTEEPDRLQFMGSQRVGHDWATSLYSIYLILGMISNLEMI